MSGKINWVSLQNLIGGLAIGTEKAFGSPPLMIVHQGWANDKHYIKYMNETRKLNIPVVEMNGDYETFKTPQDEATFNSIVQNYKIDVAVMCPICSGLSQLNAINTGSKARGSADNDQNKNMYNLTELGMRMNAKVVVFENAPAAYTKAGEKVIERLEEIAQENKFSMQLVKTDTLLHGTPQSRKRTFLMFYRDGNPGLFNYELKEYIPLAKYLSSVDESMPHYDEEVTIDSKDQFYEFILHQSGEKTYQEAMKKLAPHKTTWTSLQLSQHIGFEKAIVWFNEKAKENNETSDKERYSRGARIAKHCANKVKQGLGYWDSTTYLANDGLYVNAVISKNIHRSLHPTEERGYNIRELLHLMSMPNDFEMIDAKKNWNHISQNVPVSTATYVGTQIKEYLDGNLLEASTSFVKQDNIKQRLDTPSHQVHVEW